MIKNKKVVFSLDYFTEMVNSAKDNGLDAFALTEHFNTHQFIDVYDTLDKEFPYVHDYYEVDGVKVTEQETLQGMVQKHAPGDKLRLKVWRAGSTFDTTVTLEEKKE